MSHERVRVERAIIFSIELTEIYSFEMGFEAFAPLPMVGRLKLHPHVPSSGVYIGSAVVIVSTINSKFVTLGIPSVANLHIVFLVC